MSGYCPDCGNTICLCDEETRVTYPLRVKLAAKDEIIKVAKEALDQTSDEAHVQGWSTSFAFVDEALAKIAELEKEGK